MKHGLLCLCLVLGLCGAAVAAQEKSSILNMSRDELVKKVLELEKRIEQLEKKEAAPAPPVQEKAGLGKRVEELEKKSAGSEEFDKASLQSAQEMEQRLNTMDKGKPGNPNLTANWKDGLTFTSSDKAFSLKVGGRLQYDMGIFENDSDLMNYLKGNSNLGKLSDGVEFRRARVNLQGTIYTNYEYRAEYEFGTGNNTSRFKDVYMGITNIPYLGGIRIGHFKEPFSLELLASDLDVTFMERSLGTAFYPDRNLGIMVYNNYLEQKITAAIGVFRNDENESGLMQGNGNYNITGRFTGLPWYENEGEHLLEIGAAFSHRDPNKAIRFRERPEAHLAPRFVDTSYMDTTNKIQMDIPARNVDLVNGELALVYGPASLQGEYTHVFVDSPQLNDPEFHEFYIQGSYFLTGEHRPYKTTTATFDRVKPNKNFMDGKGGLGAWEVALRYSQLDLGDKKLNARVPAPGYAFAPARALEDITAGLTWYMNPNTKVYWNYILAHTEGIGDDNIFQMRFQIDF